MTFQASQLALDMVIAVTEDKSKYGTFSGTVHF